MSDVWSNVITGLAALGGVAVASLTQHWTDRRARRERHKERVGDLSGEFIDAVLHYRETYWLSVAGLRHGETEPGDVRADRYRARSAVTKARGRLRLVTSHPGLLAAADAAAWSAIELADIPLGPVVDGVFTADVEAALTAGRERTRTTHTAFENVAAAYVQDGSGITQRRESR
ncbi:hypothetical protein ACWEKM_45845 [Streptomyces sp. NPDC004752]